MNKLLLHTKTRLKLLLMCYAIVVLFILYPIIYLVMDHVQLIQYRNKFLTELEKTYDELDKNSLW